MNICILWIEYENINVLSEVLTFKRRHSMLVISMRFTLLTTLKQMLNTKPVVYQLWQQLVELNYIYGIHIDKSLTLLFKLPGLWDSEANWQKRVSHKKGMFFSLFF